MARNQMASDKKRKTGVDGYRPAGVILFLALVLSLAAMQMAFNGGDREGVDLFSLCSAVLLVGSSLFFVLWVFRHNERERLEKLKHEHPPVFNLNEDYRAKHDVSDVVIFAISAIAFTFLTLFFAHNIDLWALALCSAFSLFFFFMLYKSLFFSVVFTDKLIVVELKPFIKLSETYQSVQAIYYMGISRKIVFSDGKSVFVGYGIGDSRRIAAILKKHVSPDLWEPRLIWF